MACTQALHDQLMELSKTAALLAKDTEQLESIKIGEATEISVMNIRLVHIAFN